MLESCPFSDVTPPAVLTTVVLSLGNSQSSGDNNVTPLLNSGYGHAYC